MRNRPYPVLKCSSFSPIGERETRSAKLGANDNGDNRERTLPKDSQQGSRILIAA